MDLIWLPPSQKEKLSLFINLLWEILLFPLGVFLLILSFFFIERNPTSSKILLLSSFPIGYFHLLPLKIFLQKKGFSVEAYSFFNPFLSRKKKIQKMESLFSSLPSSLTVYAFYQAGLLFLGCSYRVREKIQVLFFIAPPLKGAILLPWERKRASFYSSSLPYFPRSILLIPLWNEIVFPIKWMKTSLIESYFLPFGGYFFSILSPLSWETYYSFLEEKKTYAS